MKLRTLLLLVPLLLDSSPGAPLLESCQQAPEPHPAELAFVFSSAPAFPADSAGAVSRGALVRLLGCDARWCQIRTALGGGFVVRPAIHGILPGVEIVEAELPIGPAPSRPVPTTSNPAPRRACCRICRTGKACGDSCIARSKTCRKGAGCACNGL